MTRDEYDALDLPEAEITFHNDELMQDVYVTVVWEIPLPGTPAARSSDGWSPSVSVRKGFKFTMAMEFVRNLMRTAPVQCVHCGHTDGKHLPWCKEWWDGDS